MTILISLLIISFTILWFQMKIWKLERNIIFPVFTAIFYFWTLAGGWLFSFDRLTNVGKKIGFHYYYLLEKMFYVDFDIFYLQMIWMYGFFILLFQVCIWIGLNQIKKLPEFKRELKSISIQPKTFLFIALFFLFVSIWVVKDVIIYSLILNESIYLNIRNTAINNYILHQYACWIIVVSLFSYIGLYLKQNNLPISVTKPSILFWTVFAFCNLYLIMIGSRHEVFFGGIMVLLMMTFPYRSIKHTKKLYFAVILIWLFILMLNDPIRSLMPLISKNTGLTSLLSTEKNLSESILYSNDRTFVSHKSKKISTEIIKINAERDTILYLKSDTIVLNKNELVKQLRLHPDYIRFNNKKFKIANGHISMAYQKNSSLTKIALALSNLVFSNELFAGHFSLYGVLSKNVQPKFGLSFKNLLYSFIPSTIVKKRPEDAYSYYAKQMGFKTNQGFTINYITGWYLNFAYFGLILGPLFLSILVLFPYYLYVTSKNNLFQLFAIFALCGITSFGAMMVRTGPESFKALLYESVLIPCFILFIAIYSRQFFRPKSLKNGK